MAKNSPQKICEIIIGTIRMHARGFGFVVPDDPKQCPQDIFIPKSFTENAVDGDRVEVAVNPDPKSEKGPDGKILSILERGRSHVAGTISHKDGAIMAYVPLLGPNRPVIVKKGKKRLREGDRLILEILEWGDNKKPTICTVTKKIGHISDPSCDIEAAVEEYDLIADFPRIVVEAAKAYGESVKVEDTKGRVDLTQTNCITIDPETAKDFDDALSIEKNAKGGYRLGVHIADVAHYISPATPLDIEAMRRSNSTYFPGTCIPMIPEELSNNLCSLRENVIRLTVSVLMEFDQDGTLVSSKVERTFIKSQKRFTYGEAKLILDGERRSPHADSLRLMRELALLLKAKRTERGSVDFALPELIILVNKKGKPTGVKVEEYDITHQLVEEFMLKANECVARTLTERRKPVIYRVHEEPSDENMEDFYATARALGFRVPSKPTKEDIQNLFDQAKSTPYSQQLAVGFIRNLKLAIYSPQNVGHFGLALEYYCHFTSPIRRYSDLITQRLLFNEEGEQIDFDKIAQHCSEQERKSFKAEMGVRQLKKLRLLNTWLEEDPQREYVANVTKIKPFGLFFEIKELNLEGSLHISELGRDYFDFDPKREIMVGRSTGMKYQTGTEIHVRPTLVDLIHLETKWEQTGKKRKMRR